MKTIEIDNDVYDYLLHQTVRIGESASDIMRRLLGIPSGNITTVRSTTEADLLSYISSPEYSSMTKAVDKFLGILSCTYKTNPDVFRKLLKIGGRQRKYYGLTKEEIEKSGNNVMPQIIPDSPYWVATNNDTPKKQRMLAEALKELGYSKNAISIILSSLR